MAMTRTNAALAFGLLVVASGCGEGDRVPNPPLDCSIADGYEFGKITDFSGGVGEWYCYGDPTPGGIPASTVPAGGTEPTCVLAAPSVASPGRCGDTQMMKLEANGHNFWGSGFGDWAHNAAGSRAPDGTGYEGISLWVRSAPNTDRTFLFRVEEGRTIVLNFEPEVRRPHPVCDDPLLPQAQPGDTDEDEDGCLDPEDTVGCHDPLLPSATEFDQDLNGDRCLGPGDIAFGTECRLPPPQELGDPPCYKPGVNRPGTASRVPATDECGNYFHTYITTTEDWQLLLIPWGALEQWPCPNRLEDGINPADIAGFKVEFIQGTRYEVWIDNIAFYRRRDGAGS